MKTTRFVLGLAVVLLASSTAGTLRASEAPRGDLATPAAAPATREVTLPAGTVLPVKLQSSVGSATSHPEQTVRGTLRRAVVSRGVQVLPAGTVVVGHVTHAKQSARVKGRAQVAFRFSHIEVPGEGRVAIRTATISRQAPATKGQDAAKIGGAAAGGAIIGGLIGGGDGAAKGALIGGGAGTGAVLATRGKEVHVPAGTALSVRLTSPVTIRVAR